jgi:hypothetical protein
MKKLCVYVLRRTVPGIDGAPVRVGAGAWALLRPGGRPLVVELPAMLAETASYVAVQPVPDRRGDPLGG